MNYLKKKRGILLSGIVLCVSYNFYFLFLLKDIPVQYLLYLDFLIAVFAVFAGGIGYFRFRRRQVREKELLERDGIIYQEFENCEGYEIAEHDVRILESQLQEQLDAVCNLQDYIAKWCHEVKIPLAASLLMAEKAEDAELRRNLKEQLERINQQLNSALLGCKVQGSSMDLQVKAVSLAECVRTAIHNNQYFLIRNKFTMDIRLDGVKVYTDKAWIVYVLDQLISNAVKYAEEQPILKIWSEKTKGAIHLYVEDCGQGILEQDIRRIFERGFTGTNHHNGKYKSTGMGLYLASVICDRLGHGIRVESEYGRYTRFTIVFKDNREFFNL